MKRIDQLDGVRALAIGAVFLHHAFQVKMLWAGVDLFFILSGFLITGILIGAKEKPLGSYFSHFYERRARRILPPYVVLLIVVSIFFGVEWIRHWYLFFFLMNALVSFHAANLEPLAVLWSLSVEEQFYMVWPFVVYFLDETAIAWAAGGLVVLAPLLRWVFTPHFAEHWQIYMLTPFRMDLMAVGALLAVVWRRRRDLVERFGAWGLAMTVAALGVFGALSRYPWFTTTANTRAANVWVYELTLLASLGVILWALSGRGVGLLRWSPLRYLGRISYMFYLIHVPALKLSERWIGNRYESAGVALAGTLLFSAASWRWYEQPILFWKAKSRVRREAEQDEKAITAPRG
ncbi:acyltransferase family protein [Granulicella tundricola]|uniref:Acyltransferase 3 n=1 Tax=Granulicella tundricola (strain ATCC BAA-1859 / DSM 23138 / MP5ACTX9) TaxID=1198114 RepID=E8WW11_GRATM|nr:acyltransferase [Granulicella tundricola]ADW67317.1 acyltransferase 3 [Granulicella tundricola MP5ACTX9]